MKSVLFQNLCFIRAKLSIGPGICNTVSLEIGRIDHPELNRSTSCCDSVALKAKKMEDSAVVPGERYPQFKDLEHPKTTVL